MEIFGNLTFETLGAGQLENAIIERLASDPTPATGRIYYNTTSNYYYFYNGTTWIQFAAGGSGVTSIAGTANQITASSPTGAVTLTIPSTFIAPGSVEVTTGLTVDGLSAANSFLYSGTGKLLTTTAAPTNGQLLIGSTGAAPVAAAISGTASRLSISNGAGSITLDISASYVGQASITTLGTITTGVWNGTAIAAVNGGTGQTTYTTGDILYASSSTALSKLAAGTATQVLHGGTTPSWSAVSLTADVSGTLPIGNGGTGQTTALAAFNALSPLTTKGDVLTFAGGNNVRQAVGTDGFVLTADSTQTNGIKWASASQSLTATQIAYGSATNTVTSEADLTWIEATNIMNVGSSTTSGIIQAPDNAGTGVNIRLRGGANTSGGGLPGGTAIIAGGTTTSGSGGGVTILGAAATTTGIGGTVTLTGGNGAGTLGGGPVNLTAGTGGGTNAAGGNITITSGTGGATNGAGGALSLNSGAGTGTGAGGNATLTAGTGGGTNAAGGNITITSGSGGATNGAGGTLTLVAGAAVGTGVAGDLSLSAGSSVSGNAGSVTLQGGIASTSGAGGGVTISGRNGVGTSQAGGAISITSGNSTNAVTGASVTLSGGSSATGTGGAVTITGGTGTAGTGGTTSVTGGASGSGQGGALNLNGGTPNAANQTGGLATLRGGTPGSGNGSGGSVAITGRDANGTGTGGTVTITAGSGTTNGTIDFKTGGAGTARLSINGAGAFVVAGDAGTATQVLTSGGSGAVPTWTTPTTGTVTSITVTTPAQGLRVSAGTTQTITSSGTFALTLANDLAALEALSGTGFAVRTATDTWAQRSITGTATRISVTNGDGVATSPTIDLSTLSDDGTGTFLKLTRDAYGRVQGTTAVLTADITTLVDSQYLRLDGTTTPTANISFGGFRVTNVGTPTSGTDATNKNYVDALVTGLEWKAAVAAATTVAGTLATSFENGDTIDGYTLVTGDRILIKDQADPTENGIYIVAASGAPTRSTDADTTPELNNATVFVTNGTVNSDTGWTQTTPNPVIGVDDIVFNQFTGAGTYTAGTGLSLSGNTFNVNLGAGIVELPSDEVGIDLYDALTGALILTDDGTTRSTDAASQLFLLLAGSGGLVQDATGLYITTAGVTNAMLANSTITLDADSGTGDVALGETFGIFGTPNRIETTAGTPTDNDITVDISVNYAGQTSIVTLGTVTTGTWAATTIAANHGGTGFAAYTTGDILYANSATTLAKLAAGTATQVLHGGTTPSWSAVSLTADVSGILPLANGGTNAALTATAGGIVYGTGSALAVSAAGTTGQFVLSGGASTPTFLTNLTSVVSDVGSTDLIVGTAFNVLGTTNQITTTASAQTVTFSVPSTFVAPGSVEVTTTLQVDGNTAKSFVYSNASKQVVTTAAPTDGQLLVGSTGANPIVASIQFNYDSSLDAGPALSFTVIHNLNQQFVNVAVYDTAFSMIIPNSIELTDENTVTVTVNEAIDVFIVVMGVPGVALSA